MLGDFLYELTPRDAQSLTLEVRDFIGTQLTFAGGITAQRQSTGIDIPDGVIAKVLSATVVLTPAAGFTSNINNLSLVATRAGGAFSAFANKHENNFSPAAANTYYVGLWVNADGFLLPDDDVNLQVGYAAASGFNLIAQAYMRCLLIPRGNIGV